MKDKQFRKYSPVYFFISIIITMNMGCSNSSPNRNIASRLPITSQDCEVMGSDRRSCLELLEEKKGNIAKASSLYKKACNGGEIAGCHNLGVLEEKKGNIAKASSLYKKACDGGGMNGCYNLGVLEHKKGNIAKASSLYKKACDGGGMNGCYNLGVLEHKKGNIAKASRLYKKACDGGGNTACKILIEVNKKMKRHPSNKN